MNCRVARKPEMIEDKELLSYGFSDKYIEATTLNTDNFKEQRISMTEATEFVVLSAQLDKHEAICAERYDQINARLKRLERIIMGTAGATIILLMGLLVS